MAATTTAGQKRWHNQGVRPLKTAEAHEVLDRLLGSAAPQSVVADVDWERFAAAPANAPCLPLLSALARPPVAQPASATQIVDQIRSAPAARRRVLLTEHIQQEVSRILSLAGVPDPQRGFHELGMDSLLAVELRNRLQTQLGGDCRLSTTLIFDYPTVAALAAYLEQEMTGAGASPAAVVNLAPVTPLDPTPAERQRSELDQLTEEERLQLLQAELTDLLERV